MAVMTAEGNCRRTSTDERPAVVDRKTRLGDWEADTIIGQHHREAIVSPVERK